MSIQPGHTHEKLIFEQAAQWHLLMQRSPDLNRRAAFDDWLMESRRHVRNYLLVAALDQALTRIDPRRELTMEVSAEAVAGEAVVPLQAASRSTTNLPRRLPLSRTMNWRWGMAGIAAMVLLAAVALFLPWSTADRYSTSIGEQQIIKLQDGSVMYLNTQSRVEVDYSDAARDIRLTRGEALFTVAPDAARPFRVSTSVAVVQAVGTEFNVYRHRTKTAIAVLKGRVQVSNRRVSTQQPLPVDAGQAATVASDGQITKEKVTDIQNAVAWRERRLVFRERLLGDIVLEFNRYNAAPRIRIEGADATTRRYSGIFDAYDPESLAQVLSVDEDLAIERLGTEIVIRGR